MDPVSFKCILFYEESRKQNVKYLINQCLR